MTIELELCWGTVPDAGLVELIEVAGATGFSSITIRPDMYLDAVAAGRSDGELRRRLDDAGISVGVIDPLVAGLPGIPAVADVPDVFRSFVGPTEDDCWRAALALGCELVNVAQFLGPPAPLPELCEAVSGLATRAADHDLSVSVEFIPGTGIPHLSAARQIVASTGGRAGVMFDTWHFHRSGASRAELDDLPHDEVFGIQLNDACGPPPAGYVPMVDRLLPGAGDLPLTAILRALLAGSSQVRVGVEVFSSELRKRPALEAAAMAARATRAVLDQL